MITEKIKEIFETCESLGFEKDNYINSSIKYEYKIGNGYSLILYTNTDNDTIFITIQENSIHNQTLLYYEFIKKITEEKVEAIIVFLKSYIQLKKPKPLFVDLKAFNNTINNHYQFKIKNIDFDVNDILQALDKKMKDNNITCSRIEFNYLSNAIEYLLRSYFKEQKENDLKKAISEIKFILGE